MWRKLVVLILVLGVVFGFALDSFAGKMRTETVVSSSETSTIPLPKNTTVYSHSFPIKSGEYFGLSYKVTSTEGTPRMGVEIEQSYELPTTEGASDTEWVVPDNMANVVTGVTTETQHHISFSPIPLPYARFKITELSNTATDCIVSLKVSVIEK